MNLLYNITAKPRVAPELMASHHLGFAFVQNEINTREVSMNDETVKLCKADGCENPQKKSSRSRLCCKHKYRWDTYKSYKKPSRKKPAPILPENIVKICQKHGELTISEVYKQKTGKSSVGYFYLCKVCRVAAQWARGCNKHGSLNQEQRTKDGRCAECHRNKEKSFRAANPEHKQRKLEEHRAKNPEKWAEIYKKNYARERAKLTLEQCKEESLKKITRKRGVTVQDYREILLEQNNRCKICGNEETAKTSANDPAIRRLSIDHCHSTGKIRGLLCHKCNILIGVASDSIDILHLAIIYLEESE